MNETDAVVLIVYQRGTKILMLRVRDTGRDRITGAFDKKRSSGLSSSSP